MKQDLLTDNSSLPVPVKLRNPGPDPDLCEKLSRESGYPLLFSSLLCQRGITTALAATDFLEPRLADLPSPFLMKDMEKAVSLVVQAVAEKWQICIHGDYDVDGVTATALLARYFSKLGVKTTCHQPDRLTEGYGLQPSFIRKTAPQETGERTLLITVDCGISAVDEIRLARKLGHTVIVTDHHEPPDLLPEADALINPKQLDCAFPFKELSGVGVAFFFAMGIRKEIVNQEVLSRDMVPNLKQFLDLVALGTVADVMTVTGMNRVLISAGLEVMSELATPWSSALKSINNMEKQDVTTEDISFRFAPRLNAPGRLGKPELSFELLTCDDPIRALELARIIDSMNMERRELEKEAIDSVFASCEEQEQAGASGYVVYGEYHPGVIGIIASRVVDRFHKPVIIFTDDRSQPKLLKGSGRTVDTINLYEILQDCKDEIVQFGGHPMAAGLTLDKDNIRIFKEKFNLSIARKKPLETPQKEIIIDCVTEPEELFDEQFLRLYHQLEPFGRDNPEPVFLLINPEVRRTDTIKNHLKYVIDVNGTTFRGIGFGLADRIELLQNGEVQLAVKIKKNVFRGVERTEIHTVEVF